MKNNAIVLQDITKTFSANTVPFTALKGVSFEIAEGSCTIIGGANGSGKSVLMSIIAGLTNQTSGKITTSQKVGLIFQDADMQLIGETPEEDIGFSLKNKIKNRKEITDKTLLVLEKTGLAHRKAFPARFLSGGEKRRLAVASMLALDCPILIFDEPYANLDYTGIKQVNNCIKMLKEQGYTLLILTHELEKSLGLSDHFIVLFHGEKVFDGKPEEGLKAPLENWGIRNPICTYQSSTDLIW
jgi:biotin transport system ATP-binding protein